MFVNIKRDVMAFLLLFISLDVGASIINFDDLPLGDTGLNSIQIESVTFTSTENIFIGSIGNPVNSICAYRPGDHDCQADLLVDFNSTISTLTFEVFVFDDKDAYIIDVFRDEQLLGQSDITNNGMVTFTSFSYITSINIRYIGESDGTGAQFDNFSYTVVPLPASIWLFISGVAFVGVPAFIRKTNRVAGAVADYHHRP